MMKKRDFFFPILSLLLLLPLAVWSQQAMELQVIGASGTVLANSSGANLHFTVGELMVAEKQNNNILPQGFHQIIVWQIVPDEEPATPALEVKVYPNPTSNFLQIETTTPVQVSMYDLNGRLVLEVTDIASFESFDLSGFASGTYFLQALDTEKRALKTFKIQVIK